MDEKDPSMDLPPEIACIHRKWNVRSVAYRTLTTHFQKLHPSSDEWQVYMNVIANIAAESFPAIREQALEAVFQFVQKCDTAQKLSSEVIHSLLDTIPSNTKPEARHLLEQIILKYVEIGCSRDVFHELLSTAVMNQVPNVSTTCIEIITKILSVFGPTSFDLAQVLDTLPYFQEAEESGFRSALEVLVLEVYRWQGKESIKNVGQILNPAELKDVMQKYENPKYTTPLRPTRHVPNNKQIANGSSRTDDLPSDQETDLLKQINDDFFRKLESPEWTERRDALMELRKVLESSFRLRSGNYESLLTALKKVIIEDQCVIVVGLAIASVTGIAKGLRQQFSPYAVGICRILLEKFVEKRQNITEQLRKALDVIITTTSFEALIKTINCFLGSKNPTIRFETIQLLSRMFKKTTKQTLRKSEFSVLYKSLVNCLHHGQLIIREKSFIALAIAFNIAGEGVIMPYLENVDPSIKKRIKNYNSEQDFEEKYNEIKYRNVAKKEFKNEDKFKVRKENSSYSNLKESKKQEKEISDFSPPTRGPFKTQTQNALVIVHDQKIIKPIRKNDNQPIFNYNRVTKRWSSFNSMTALESCSVNTKSKNLIDCNSALTTPYKEHRKKENVKRYPYRKPYTVQRKENYRVLSKRKKKKKKIFSRCKKETSDKNFNQIVEASDRPIGDNILVNKTNLSNNPTKLRPELPNNKPFLEYLYKKENPKKREPTDKYPGIHFNAFTNFEDVPKSTKERIKMENATPSPSIQESSELSQPVQQSVKSLDSSKCGGEGFIVLTENEVKKLLGLKRISAVSDDSYSILPDWTSKKSLFKRSYKIFQISKGAIDRETQTSLTTVESSVDIVPEGGVIDLTKAVDVIPTQTAGVSIEEKGTDPRRIKKYNRGTQWTQRVQTETPDTWSKRETSNGTDWQGLGSQKANQSQHKEESPLKMQSVVVKEIKYRRPSGNDIGRQWPTSDQLRPGADHSSERTMEINTFTITRSDPIDTSNNPSESLTSELTGNIQGRSKTKAHQERNQNHVEKEKRQKKIFSKSDNSEDRISKNSTNPKHVKKIKRKYTHQIMVQSNKETTSGQNDISSRTLFRLKKIERTKHHSLTKAASRRNESKSLIFTGYVSHKSDTSVRSPHQKGRRSNNTKKNSKFQYENGNDTSSGSYKEGCNFLPFMAKSIMGHQDVQKEKRNNNAHKKQQRHKSQRNDKKGNRSINHENNRKKSEHPLNRRSSRKCYSTEDKGQKLNLMTDAREMDPETKQMVIKELLKVCDISQATFDKMVRRKVSPPRPSLLSPKAVLQRVNDLSSTAEQESSGDRSAREHKVCTIM